MSYEDDPAVDPGDVPAVSVEYPYVGPLTFTAKEADRFFGREREARDLLALVARERLVLFYAQSGAGKSSLLNARLIPNLPDQGFDTLPVARVSGEIPPEVDPAQVKNIFVYNLILCLNRGLPAAERATPAELASYSLLRHLAGDEVAARSEAPAENGTAPAPDAAPDFAPTVLVIDQFEEIFTTHVDLWEERRGFFAQLRTTLEWLPNLWIVLTMREDYVPPLEPYAELLPNRLRARFYMQRMEETAALEAVERPAARFGRPFDPGVAKTLVDNLRRIRVQYRDEPPLGQYVEPVQLQVVCLELWKKVQNRPLGPISEADLPLDYIDQALTNFYESALANTLADPRVPARGVTEPTLRDWFSHELITEMGIRNTIPRNEETDLTGTLPNVAVDILARHFLVRTEPRAGGNWVELVHDRFIGPIQDSNQAWRNALLQEDPLLRAADEWDKTGRSHKDLLLTGTALQQALGQADTAPRGSLIRDFLDASQQAQREHDLADAQRREEEAIQRAAAATRQAEQEQRTARALRWQRIALAVLAGLVLVFLLIALQQRGDALNKAADLDTALAELQIKADDLDAALGEITTINQDLEKAKTAAEDNARRADSKAREADAARLTALSLSLAGQSRNSTGESALLFGQAATAISPTLEAQTALLIALNANYRDESGEIAPFYLSRSLTTTGEFPLQRLAINGDGSLIALGDRRGGLQFWDTQAQRPLGPHLQAHTRGAITGLAFDPSRPRLVTASGNPNDPTGQQYDILLWDLQQATPVSRTLATNVNSVSSLAFSPNGHTLAVDEASGRLTLWTLDDRVPVSRTLATDPDSSGALAFDPTGRLAVAGNGQVTLWYDLTTSQPMSQTLPVPDGQPVMDVQFSPDGTRLAAAGANGIILSWMTDGDRRLPEELTQREGIEPRSLAFAADGQLAVGWEDAVISLVGPGEDERAPRTLLTRPGAVIDLAFDPTQPDLMMAVIDRSTAPQVWDFGQRREFAAVARLVSPVPVQSGKPTQDSPDSVALDTASLSAISPDGQKVAVVDATGSPFVVNLAEPPLAVPIPAESVAIYTALAFSPDGRLLAVASCGPASPGAAEKPGAEVAQTTIEKVPASQVPLRLLTGPEQMPLPAANTPPSQDLCAANSNMVEVWDVSGQLPQRTQVLDAASNALRSLAFHPQEDVLVGGSADGTILRWDMASASPDYLPLEQVPQLVALTFDQTGTRLAALGETGLVRVWNWANGARLASQTGGVGGEQYSHLAFVNEDAWLATVCSTSGAEKAACSAGEVVLWDARTLERLSPRLVLNQPANDLVYDANRQVLVSLLPNQLVTWRLGRTSWPDLACARAGRNLTYSEWSTAFAGQSTAAYDRNRTCPEFPLDDTFVTAKRAAAADAIRDCTQEGRLEGIGLLREAAGMQVTAPASQVPSDEIIRILSEQALSSLRTEPFELVAQARACLEQADAQLKDDGQAGFDVTQAVGAAQRLVLAERGLQAALDSESLALILDNLQTSMDLRAQWPGDLQTPLAAAYYTLCDRGVSSEACAQLDALAQVVSYGTTLVGTIDPGQTSSYYFRGQRSDIVDVALDADNGEFDPVVRLEGPGDASVENDDSPQGGTLDSLIAGYILPGDGVYRIVPRAYSGEGRYRLSLQGQRPSTIQLGETRSGLAEPGTVWSFQGQAGDIVGIAMQITSGSLEPYVQLLGPDLQVVAEDESGSGSHSTLLVTSLPADGTYLVRAGRPGSSGQYSLSLLEPRALPPAEPQSATTDLTPLWVFTGTQGSWINLAMDAAGAFDDTIDLSLLRLGSAILAEESDTGEVLNARIYQVVLPADGQYVVRASSLGRTLPYSLTLTEITPLALAAGDVVTGTTASHPVWVFSGRAGDILDLTLVRSGNGFDPRLEVVQADGTLLAIDDNSGGGDLNARVSGLILPADGAYFVHAGPPENSIPYTLTMATVTPPLLIAGETFTSTTAVDPMWTFEGEAGQVVSLDLTSQSFSFSPSLKLVDAAGRQLAADAGSTGPGNARIHARILPQTGRYYVHVYPVGTKTPYQLTLTTAEPPSIVPAQPVNAAIAEIPVWRLAAEAGQLFNIALTMTVPGFDPILKVYDSQGTLLAQDNGSGYPNRRVSPFVVPATGTYLLAPGPGYSTDWYTLLVSPITPTQTLIGSSVISTTAAQEYWTFDGQAGQVVDISLGDTSDRFDPYLTLFAPDGTWLRSDDDTGGNYNALIRAMILPQTGRYLVRVGPNISPVPYILRVSAAPTASLAPGSSVTLNQDTVWTFDGEAGELVDLLTDDASSLTLLGAGGVELAAQASRLSSRLAATGRYTVVVDILEGSGVHTLRLETPGADVAELPVDRSVTGQLEPGDADYWSFAVTDPGGAVITTTATGVDVVLNLFAPGGARVATSTGQNPLLSGLPVTGTYLLTVQGTDPVSRGAYTVTRGTIDLPPMPQACESTATPADFGSIRVGSRVILGAHRPVRSDRAWTPAMQAYVGQPTRVRELNGVDGQGCPTVHVDLDNGTYGWRVRDLVLLP